MNTFLVLVSDPFTDREAQVVIASPDAKTPVELDDVIYIISPGSDRLWFCGQGLVANVHTAEVCIEPAYVNECEAEQLAPRGMKPRSADTCVLSFGQGLNPDRPMDMKGISFKLTGKANYRRILEAGGLAITLSDAEFSIPVDRLPCPNIGQHVWPHCKEAWQRCPYCELLVGKVDDELVPFSFPIPLLAYNELVAWTEESCVIPGAVHDTEG